MTTTEHNTDWQENLDLAGPFASSEVLNELLHTAPAGVPGTDYLRGFITGRDGGNFPAECELISGWIAGRALTMNHENMLTRETLAEWLTNITEKASDWSEAPSEEIRDQIGRIEMQITGYQSWLMSVWTMLVAADTSVMVVHPDTGRDYRADLTGDFREWAAGEVTQVACALAELTTRLKSLRATLATPAHRSRRRI